MPLERHPPQSDRFTRVTSSTQLIGTDARAERRNADQIRLQTSGEIGSFYIDAETEGIKLGKTRLKPPVRQKESTNMETQYEYKCAPITARSTASSFESAPSARSTARSEYGGQATNRSFGSPSASGSNFATTWQTLDRSFSNANRRDLFAASMPGRPAQELVWCAASNNRGAQQSKSWAGKLRKDSVA